MTYLLSIKYYSKPVNQIISHMLGKKNVKVKFINHGFKMSKCQDVPEFMSSVTIMLFTKKNQDPE